MTNPDKNLIILLLNIRVVIRLLYHLYSDLIKKTIELQIS